MAPDCGERGAGYDETGAEAEPEAEGPAVIAEGEEVADWQANSVPYLTRVTPVRER